MKRRDLIQRTAAALGGLGLYPFSRRLNATEGGGGGSSGPGRPPAPFLVSLAEWSLVKTLHEKKLDNLDFPRYAKTRFGIDTVEYVDQFFKDKVRDIQYLEELKKRCEGEGVRSGLIMVDTAGDLGAEDPKQRRQAVDNHLDWIEAAHFLGR